MMGNAGEEYRNKTTVTTVTITAAIKTLKTMNMARRTITPKIAGAYITPAITAIKTAIRYKI